MRSWWVAAGPAAIAACSLTTDLDGYSRGGATSDAGVLSHGAPDADASAPDGGATGDGGDRGDSGATDDASRPFPGCADLAVPIAICEDFDHAAPETRWTFRITGAHSIARVSTTRSHSGTSSLESTITTELPEPRAGAWTRSLPESVSHVRLGYGVYIDQRPAVAQYEVAILRFVDPAGTRSEFYLAVGATADVFGEQESKNDAFRELGVGVLPTGQWVRVVIELVLSEPRSMRVTVDNHVVLDEPSLYGLAGKPEINAGITYGYNRDTAGHLFFDDLTFEILP